ncbi:CHAD domain-containing protein [Methanosarcina horonobensis]|uniref:CHAD domain-containing protein n=1 Tax=Methanosarcina horonobensis TaxID=418008 RepID=UPI000B19AFFB|nr:CHAD domain-containing protein [Methanosarcina horonobensis]
MQKKAEKRSELWEYLFNTELRFIQARESLESGVTDKTKREKVEEDEEKGEEKLREKVEDRIEKRIEKKKRRETQKFTVSPEDSMAFVAHRIFAYQFSQMLAHEKGTRKGEDIEELHDMRVAVRRMRAAAIVFGEYLESEKVEPHLKGLRRTLGALGGVRDLDVFREKAEAYLKNLPPGHEHDLDPLFLTLEEEREKAREDMLDYLDSEKYSRFKKRFFGISGLSGNLDSTHKYGKT